MTILTDKQKEIAKILIGCAKKGTTITFSDLEKSVGIGKRKVGKQAGAVSKLCNELNLPLLSVLVVYKHNGMTGYGFFDEFFGDEIKSVTEKEICDREKIKVYACDNWSRLKQYI